MKILVTGAAGFIGSKLVECLAGRGDEVLGLDNLNDYYDLRLKAGRLAALGILPSGNTSTSGTAPEAGFRAGEMVASTKYPCCRFILMGIDDKASLDALFDREHFDAVINMAAQSGVRYSIENPYAYLQNNLLGFLNVLEACRHHPVRHLVFASSSSVYGMDPEVPYREDARADTPVSLYGAIKRADELMAHSYSKLYGIPVTALRFFTVYGPWGRPDMSPMLFATAISKGEPIKVFNNGDMIRDFTYIDDIAEGTLRVLDRAPDGDVAFEIYNIGCSHPVRLMDFITELEQAMGREARKIFLPMQDGDVYQTNADCSRLEAAVGYRPQTLLHEGIASFVRWFQSDLNPLR